MSFLRIVPHFDIIPNDPRLSKIARILELFFFVCGKNSLFVFISNL